MDLTTAIQTAQQQTQQQITDVERSILDRVAEYEAAGISRDQALGLAVDDVAAQLGTTREDLLTRIGETEAALGEQITGVSQDLQTKYDALTDGQKALANQLTQQGIDLNTAIDFASQQAAEALAGTEQRLTSEIQTVADLLGKPARSVTQADIDLVNQMLQGEQQVNTAYDANQDGKIDQADVDLLTRLLAGDVNQGELSWAPAAGTVWGPTGLFAEQAAEAERTRQAQAAEAERTRQQQRQLAQRTQRMGNVNTMMGMLSQAPDIGGQQVTVKAPDPAKIGYIYDWNSIFANPAQEKMFVTPFSQPQPAQQRPMGFGFAQGGAVRGELDDVNDELLKMLKG